MIKTPISNDGTLHEETLEMAVKKFADKLPYWSKYLAEKILSGNTISDNDIETSYSYLLEELNLIPTTDKPEISISYNSANSKNYKIDLIFTKLENVEGVNALVENQPIEFCRNMTIIYGENGAGKSGYVRLLKKAFSSKSPEDILPNVYLENGHKPISAKFTFNSDSKDIPILYSEKEANPEFEQLAVFDGKSVSQHLSEKNEFEFRPAGLSFFTEYTEAIKAIEKILNEEIASKQTENNFALLFEGESEIKTIIENLSDQTNIEDIKKYTPFSEKDRIEKEKIEKEYDELVLAAKGNKKEIQNLENIKVLLGKNKLAIENLNKYFTNEYLTQINTAITDCVIKEGTAKAKGIEKFKTKKIEGIGTPEWKDFITAAAAFANIQKTKNKEYPENADNCLFCHQSLSDEAHKLISNYWLFIKSIEEENVKKAKEFLKDIKQKFEKLNFDIFPDENTLTVWLSKKYPSILASLQQTLSGQKTLAADVVLDIETKTANKRIEVKTNVIGYATIESAIDTTIKMLNENEQSKELEKILKKKTKLIHKEKLNTHFAKIDTYIKNQVWLKDAGKVNFAKKKITDTEKLLSDKYFNQKYIDTFNAECKSLDGNFGIVINHTGTGGKSYRQLKLMGRNPNTVLSEGEQKVIAIADFLAETKLSEVNRGIILDDPVNSLDDARKSKIAERLVKESLTKQVIIFTHDLIFLSCLVTFCEEYKSLFECHWIEKLDDKPGTVWLRNTPSFEKSYKKSGKAQQYYNEAKNLGPEQRENKLKNGFAALRTSYESLVVFDLFKGVVQRFNERVSIDSLKTVFFTSEIRDELIDCYVKCCRYMEGHSHSDKYVYMKPQLESLKEEISRFDAIQKKIREASKGT